MIAPYCNLQLVIADPFQLSALTSRTFEPLFFTLVELYPNLQPWKSTLLLASKFGLGNA